MQRRVSLEELGAFFSRISAEAPLIPAEAAKLTAPVLAEAVKEAYGSHELADLAEATQIERAELGFTPNDPLLRDGSLLRDSIEPAAIGGLAVAGSNEVVAKYSEFGFINARTGRPVPARPAMREGARATVPLAGRIAHGLVRLMFTK